MENKIEPKIEPGQKIIDKRIDQIHEELMLYGRLVDKHITALSTPYFVWPREKGRSKND